jgi:putative Flp pilus-assembly TadE/G-like protein
MRLRLVSRLHHNEAGVVTAWFIGISLLLFGILALSFDIGLLHLQRRVGQNAADPAVLAGAAYLDRCPRAAAVDPLANSDDPLAVADAYANRNLAAVGANFADDEPVQKALGSYHVQTVIGGETFDADWQSVKARVTRNQSYLFGRALGLITPVKVPAEAEAVCGPISEGSVCPFWIEAPDPGADPVYDGDGNVVSAYGLNVGGVYGMKVNNQDDHYGALRLPWASGVNAWRSFLAGGCEAGENEINVCEGCTVPNEPGNFGNPVHQALEGGSNVPHGLYDIEKEYASVYGSPNLFPNGHLDCDLALTTPAGDTVPVETVRNYDAAGNPVGDPLSPSETVAVINQKTNPEEMAANGAPCGGLRKDGSPVPELIYESIQGRFMYIVMTASECQSACNLPVLGILRMYIVCWNNQEASSGNIPASKVCAPNTNPAGQTIYGVFADFTAPNLLGGGGLGTNPLGPFHVVLVQ